MRHHSGGHRKIKVTLDCPHQSYKRLSRSLECVQELLIHTTRVSDRASLGVLYEDLTALLEECEEFLLEPQEEGDRKKIGSFFSRSETVLEEAEDLIYTLRNTPLRREEDSLPPVAP
jgi:hypothetical protein